MNGNNRILILCVSVCYFVCVESGIVQVIEPEIEDYDGGETVKFFSNSSNNDGPGRQVHSTVYQTVNKYYCSLDSIIEGLAGEATWHPQFPTNAGTYWTRMLQEASGSHLMVYGTKGWTFPVQDVNLTLRFPPADKDANLTKNGEEYIITGFKVILFIDGPRSQGFITDGGVLEDTITLSFISSHLTTLSYEFWIFGVRKNNPGIIYPNSLYRLCN